MKQILAYTACLIIAAGLFSGCYEDKGNYIYEESITDIDVQLDKIYGIRKENHAMTTVITPTITTKDGDKSYLRYLWLMNSSDETSISKDTVGHDEVLTVTIDPNDKNFSYTYDLRLMVEDTRTQTMTMRATQLQIIKPFSYSWTVLHEQDGHAELGTVEYMGSEILVTPNAYTQESGTSLSGKPRFLCVRQNSNKAGGITVWGYESQSQLYIGTTNQEESGLLNQTERFKLMANWSRLISPVQADQVDFNHVEANGGSEGLLLNSKGHVFRNNYASPFMFQMLPGTTFQGDYHIEKAIAGPHTGIGYDNVGHRFVHLAIQSGDFWNGYAPPSVYNGGPIEEIPYRQGEDGADPGKIDENEKLVDFINGYHYEITGMAIWQKYSAYAYMLAPGNRSHVYVFRYYALTHTDVPCMPGYFEFVTPKGITEDTPMTSGYEYNNILFYAVDNKVYRLDISTGQSSLIYQHEDTEAEISCLKMAVEGYAAFDGNDDEGTKSYGHPYCRTLGVGVNTSDGKGEFVVLQLNTSGKIDENKKYPSIQTHQGFGKITDIAFI